jgi:hypothetical protein
MNSSRVGNWLQIIGNLGLVIGLVLVAVQIKQNNDLAKAQLLSDGWLAAMQRETALFGENPAASIARASVEPDQLTDEDLVVLDAVMLSSWVLGTRVTTLDAAGYGFFAVEDFARVAAERLDNPYGQAWFNAPSPLNRNPVVRDLVAQRFAELGPAAGSGNLERFREIRAYISEHQPTGD